MNRDDFEAYRKQNENRILKTYEHVNGASIISVYDVEPIPSGQLFTAKFDNGEVLCLFSQVLQFPSINPFRFADILEKKIETERLMYHSSENLIFLSLNIQTEEIFIVEDICIVVDRFKELKQSKGENQK